MTPEERSQWWKAVAMIATFTIIGFPLAGYLWDTLNDVLALEATGRQVLLSLPVLAAFIGVLYVLSRVVGRVLPETTE